MRWRSLDVHLKSWLSLYTEVWCCSFPCPQHWVRDLTVLSSVPWRPSAGLEGSTSSWRRSSHTDLTSCVCRKLTTTMTPFSQFWPAWVTAANSALNPGHRVWVWRATTARTAVRCSSISHALSCLIA